MPPHRGSVHYLSPHLNGALGEGPFRCRVSSIVFLRNRQNHVATLIVPLEGLAEGEKEFRAIFDSIAIAPEKK